MERLATALTRGAPILGEFVQNRSLTSNWMATLPDERKLVELSIPGTHDAATWNYSQTRQDELSDYASSSLTLAKYYRCQEKSMFDMLDGGVRFFDWRIAYNPGNETIGFHHGAAVLDPNATLQDVLYGFYHWLDQHPTETVLVSINHEGSTGTPDDATYYKQIYDTLNSGLSAEYWVQANGTIGTLGESRGKLVFLQRFSWDKLPSADDKRFGINLPGDAWTDNGRDITIIYNNELDQKAFIEDFYEMDLDSGSSTDAFVSEKFNATTAHLKKASSSELEQLWITFASGYADYSNTDHPITPEVMALGDDTAWGMNQRLLLWLFAHRGRLGVVVLDFFGAVPGLAESIIALNYGF